MFLCPVVRALVRSILRSSVGFVSGLWPWVEDSLGLQTSLCRQNFSMLLTVLIPALRGSFFSFEKIVRSSMIQGKQGMLETNM